MNKFLIIIILILIVLITIYYAVGFNVNNISALDLKQKINHSKSNIGIIDVRTKKEYDSGHIDGCIWIPLSDLNSNIDEIKSQNFDEIYTVCLSGGRSAKAVNILKKYDIKAVNIRGGMISLNSLK